MRGSSPRVRGKPCSRTCRPRRARLIPACAGKTGGRPRRRAGRAAHPRVCGENLYEKYPDSAYSGSSPRVRGKQERVHRPLVPPRLIPACAGKTRTTSRTVVWSTAHPRVCGENALVEASPLAPIGSSPRVRGKQRRRENGGSDTGLIPACAGKTCRGSRFSRARTAHPRVCGENGRRDVLIHADPGSSPRVRGKPPTRPCARPRGGLIPACAGKTSSSPRAPSRAWAHPRVCGENFLAYFQEMRPDGSSPRVRGKLEHCLQAVHRFGLIPACAGKT